MQRIIGPVTLEINETRLSSIKSQPKTVGVVVVIVVVIVVVGFVVVGLVVIGVIVLVIIVDHRNLTLKFGKNWVNF